jgi:hypothetical protein
MTKSELRKARKAAKSQGLKLTGELAIPKNPISSNRTRNRANSRLRALARKG